MRRTFSLLSLLLFVCFFISGCGETVNGVIKDTKRIGNGVKTIFVRE